jgi:DNA polymerase-3 subunit delta
MLARMVENSAAPPLGPVTLVIGPEDLLVDRAVAAVIAAVRAQDGDADIRDLPAGLVAAGTLSEASSPSLFSDRKAVVLRNVQDLAAEPAAELKSYLAAPVPDVVLVLTHPGGVKGKAIVEAARKAGAHEVECAKITKPGDRIAFVRHEFRQAGRSVNDEAARALLDAVGSDLREIASACGQLVADTEGAIDVSVVKRYYTGRAEVTSFAVADRAVEGRTVEALEHLRWALAVGVAPVLVTSALAQGLRALGKLGSAPRGMRPADLARELGMPPWKVDRVRQQLRGWSGDGVAEAIRAVAEADAAIKGAGDDPGYALERAIVAISQARG